MEGKDTRTIIFHNKVLIVKRFRKFKITRKRELVDNYFLL